MAKPETKPELFIDENIVPEWGKCKKRIPVSVPVTLEGAYNENGQYRNAKGKTLPIIGFNKLTGEWFGQGFIEEEKNSI